MDPTPIPPGVTEVRPAIPLAVTNVTNAVAPPVQQYDIIVYGRTPPTHATWVASGPDDYGNIVLEWKFNASGYYELFTAQTNLSTPAMTGLYPGLGGWSSSGGGSSANMLNPGKIQRPK